MQIRRTALTLSLALGLAAGACAAPAGAQHASTDDMDKFLVERGLMGQLQQMGQTVQQRTAELVVNAMGFLGVPYKRGGNSADAGGFDCSGFVRAMYEQTLGLMLPRRAEQQAAATQTIDKTELQPGDLVFFNTLRRAFSHVGIYVGDGKFIHSPRPGAQVRVESMQTSYWARRFDGARRVAGEAPATVAAVGAAQAVPVALPARMPIEQPQP
ncbi:MAG: C40 family peptidase [Burkholderiales bacterium]|nr:C40 family peptidase [Burkholderiales bacterium]